MPFETILVPIDFSPHSARAVEVAVEFAKVFGGEIRLLHAYSFPVSVAAPYEYQIPANILGEAREAVVRQLDAEIDTVSGTGVKVSGKVVDRAPSQAIVEEAEEAGADLIVMGTRGASGLAHVLLGSVAERTLRHAPCPVLTVHAPAE